MASLEETTTLRQKNTEKKHIFPIVFFKIVLKRSLAILLLLAIWELIPRIGLVEIAFFPPFSEVVRAWFQLLLSGELLNHVGSSLFRSFIGFSFALIVAIPLGLLVGWYKPVAETLTPVLELFRNTAALAILPVFILILGIGESSKISIVMYACSWPILLNTVSAVKEVDPLLIKSAKSMGLSSFRLFQKVVLPASVPTIFTGIRLAGASSILVLIAAEMVGATSGLGYLINYSQLNFEIPNMYAGIITISLVGLGFNWILTSLERYFSAWKHSQKA
ncbi:ABC transporter permease [Niallia sp. 01092]|uniref:ABC transporter permease n=1 Tax=Niallia sp. 01092 TaxID=3457759 RepID=UPI003FD3A405